MSCRVHYAGLNVTRPEGEIGKYKSIPHHHRGEVQFLGRWVQLFERGMGAHSTSAHCVCVRAYVYACRYKLLRYSKERQHLDGLNNLRYSPAVSLSSLYKNITVELHPELAPIQDY